MPIRGWMSKVDLKTRVRLQRMSIAGGTEPSGVDETITWYKYPDKIPNEPGMYLVRVNKDGDKFIGVWNFEIGEDRWKSEVQFWSNLPLSPDTN